MSANIHPPQIAHFSSLSQQRRPVLPLLYFLHHKDFSFSAATIRHDFEIVEITTITTYYKRTPIGMAVFLALILAAVFIMLALAIRMTYLDDQRARRPPSALPVGERMVRCEDDVVYVKREGSTLHDKIWGAVFLFPLGRKKSSGLGVDLGEDVIAEMMSRGQQ